MNKILKILLFMIITVTSTAGWSAGGSDTSLIINEEVFEPSENVNEQVDIIISNYNTGARDNDWVGIYRKDQPSNAWEHVYAWNWIYSDAHGSAALSQKLKDMPEGEYEVRLFFNNSYQLESKVAFKVYAADTPYMILNQSTFESSENVNEQVDIIISNYNTGARDNDWVGIYRKDQPSNAWEHVYAWNWIYPDAHGSAALSRKIKDMPAGEYEVRLFFNNSYELEAKITFTVVNADDSAYKFPPNTQLTPIATRDIARPTKTSTEDINRATVKDPQFGSTITLLSKSVNGYGHPKSQSWNADMTLLKIGYRLYNATTLKESPITSGLLTDDEAFAQLGSPVGNSFRWSYVDPNVFYTLHPESYIKAFIKNTIIGNTVKQETLFDFDKIAGDFLGAGQKFEKVAFGTNESHFDKNDERVVFTAKKIGDDHIYALLCNMQRANEGCKIKMLPDTSWGDIYVNGGNRPLHDWISITPNGDRILEAKHINVAQYANGNNHVNYEPESRIYMYDLNFENRQEISGVAGHGDIGLDKDGSQVYVQNDWRLGRRGVYAYNLDAPAGQRETKLLPNVYNGGHISCQNYKRPGWCYVSTRLEGYNEVFALKLDGSGTVNRFVQTREKGPYNSTYGGVSPDGKRVIFRSYWGGNARHAYHAALEK